MVLGGFVIFESVDVLTTSNPVSVISVVTSTAALVPVAPKFIIN